MLGGDADDPIRDIAPDVMMSYKRLNDNFQRYFFSDTARGVFNQAVSTLEKVQATAGTAEIRGFLEMED